MYVFFSPTPLKGQSPRSDGADNTSRRQALSAPVIGNASWGLSPSVSHCGLPAQGEELTVRKLYLTAWKMLTLSARTTEKLLLGVGGGSERQG